VLAFGKGELAGLVSVGEVLSIRVDPDGRVVLE
jgi:hypothetical protein